MSEVAKNSRTKWPRERRIELLRHFIEQGHSPEAAAVMMGVRSKDNLYSQLKNMGTGYTEIRDLFGKGWTAEQFYDHLMMRKSTIGQQVNEAKVVPATVRSAPEVWVNKDRQALSIIGWVSFEEITSLIITLSTLANAHQKLQTKGEADAQNTPSPDNDTGAAA